MCIRDSSVSDIKSALDDNGLAVPTCIYLGDWFDTTGEAYAAALDEIKTRLEIAAVSGRLMSSPALQEDKPAMTPGPHIIGSYWNWVTNLVSSQPWSFWDSLNS